MILLYYKIIAAIFIFVLTLIIAIYPIKKKRSVKPAESLELGEALASGIFLGAAFFHMLPDAISNFNELYPSVHYPIPEFICVLGFLLLLFLERISLYYSTLETKNTIPYILTSILIIHALTEGAAVGIGYHFSETLMLLIAIVAHKGSESFALSTTLLKHELPITIVMFIIILFSAMTPLGIILGSLVNHSHLVINGKLIEALFNAFAAGTFLYISTLHHIHFHQHAKDTQGLLEFTSLVLGVSAMGIIACFSSLVTNQPLSLTAVCGW